MPTPVVVEYVAESDLTAKIQEAKDANRRVLALSFSKLERTTRVSKDYRVTEYVLVTQ